MQVEFFKLVNVGDHSGALKVASSHLGPLAGKYPALLKPLRETLFALLQSSEEPSGKHLPLGALATSLQVLYFTIASRHLLCDAYLELSSCISFHPLYCSAGNYRFLYLFLGN